MNGNERSVSAVPEWDVLVVGAGPAGLACGIALREAGFRAVLVDRGCLADSIYRFPDNMRFFSTAPGLEIGGVPFAAGDSRPTRREALDYYRRCAVEWGLDVRQRTEVNGISGHDGDFAVQTSRGVYRAAKVVLATGYYGQPNWLGVPGEDLPKVAHYYRDAHPYHDTDVVVIGGRNSAGVVASELSMAGARVTMIHRRDQFGMKPWIAEQVQASLDAGRLRVLWNSTVAAIQDTQIAIETPAGVVSQPNDFVFAMTGYTPDLPFLQGVGIPLSAGRGRPWHRPGTFESGRAGVYLAGTVLAGKDTHEISIENGRTHGAVIAKALRQAARPTAFVARNTA